MAKKSELKLYSAGGQPLASLVGKWVNELDSVLEVRSQSPNGEISGDYTSEVSGGGGSLTGPFSGFVATDTIGWSVSWNARFPSVTSWSGKILKAPDGSPILYTLWHLSRGVQNAEDWWQSFLSGSDRFTRLGA